MRPQIVGLGAGGHAKAVLEALRSQGQYEIVGLTDVRPTLWHSTVCGVPVLGGDDSLARLRADGVSAAFIGVGSIGDPSLRRRLYSAAHTLGFKFPAAVHAQAHLAAFVEVGEAAHILVGAIVNPGVTIGAGAILNSGCIVEHDCRVGVWAHIAPGARLGGGVEVGDGAHVGIGAIVLPEIRIGAGAIVGAGAVVTKNVSPGTVVYGVPARVKGELSNASQRHS